MVLNWNHPKLSKQIVKSKICLKSKFFIFHDVLSKVCMRTMCTCFRSIKQHTHCQCFFVSPCWLLLDLSTDPNKESVSLAGWLHLDGPGWQHANCCSMQGSWSWLNAMQRTVMIACVCVHWTRSKIDIVSLSHGFVADVAFLKASFFNWSNGIWLVALLTTWQHF